MKKLTWIVGALVTVCVFWLLYFFGFPFALDLMIRRPWADEKVSAAEDARDRQARRQFEEMYQKVMTEAVAKQDTGICNHLPEQVHAYSRNSAGGIRYSPTYTGGPVIALDEFALVRYQCKLGYAVTYLDPATCIKYADNEIMKYRCFVEVAQEMRLQNLKNYPEVCSMIPPQYRDEIRDCSDLLRTTSQKSRFVDKIDWGV